LNRDAQTIAEELAAVTTSAATCIDEGDWESAGRFLRRREQLLTQFEACPNDECAGVMTQVAFADEELKAALEIAAREGYGPDSFEIAG
jgi:hypothetical protein